MLFPLPLPSSYLIVPILSLKAITKIHNKEQLTSNSGEHNEKKGKEKSEGDGKYIFMNHC